MDFLSAVCRTWGARVVVAGIALIVLAPLPLVVHISASGTGGNPLGLGLLTAGGLLLGSCLILTGAIGLSAELIVRKPYGVSGGWLGSVAFGLLLLVGCYELGAHYVAALYAVLPNGQTQTKAFAKDIGILRIPDGFTYSDLERNEASNSFKLDGPAGSGWLLITIERSGKSTATEHCASQIRASAIATRKLAYTIGNDRKRVVYGSESSLTFFSAQRRYTVTTRALDPANTMVGAYEWKDPGTRAVATPILLDVARQLCAGADGPKAIRLLAL